MCGRFAIDATLNELIEAFVADGHRFSTWQPSWNIAPTQTIPLVIEVGRTSGPPERLIGPARWSLTPSWSPTLALHYPTFNARSETVGEKTSFRPSLSHHRGLIPASCFYEWRHVGGSKIPYCVRPTTTRFFAFAALYSVWKDPQTEVKTTTATIVTRPATEALSWLHDRQPIMVPQGLWKEWLNPEIAWDQAAVDRLVVSTTAESAAIEAHEVEPLRGDGPHLMERREVNPSTLPDT